MNKKKPQKSAAQSLQLLLVEDEPAQAQLVQDILVEKSNVDFKLSTVDTLKLAIAALEKKEKKPFDLVLLDLNLPDSKGNETLKALRDIFPDVPIVVLTGVDDTTGEHSALEMGAQDYLIKGHYTGDDLVRSIYHAVQRQQKVLLLEEERNVLRGLIDKIKIGDVDGILKEKHSPQVMRLLDDAYIEELLRKIKKQRYDLDWLATRDRLTNLYNKVEFEARLDEVLSFSERHHYSFAVFFIDLDKFKDINDSKGHAVGDKLLQEVSVRWQACLRKADIFGRLGGDEFGVIVPFLEKAESAGVVADRLIKALDEPFRFLGVVINLNVSIGVASYPLSGTTAKELLKHADSAMYRAKKNKKSEYQHYTLALQKTHRRRAMIKEALASALENNEFYLCYQPILAIKTQEVVAIEVLLQWQNQAFSRIKPSEFMPIAQEIGLMISLGEWVIQTAVLQYAKWRSQFGGAFTINVTIDTQQMATNDAIKRLKRALKNGKADLTGVVFELSEATLAPDVDILFSHAKALHKLGVHFSLSDFGAGRSFFQHLSAPFMAGVKLDPSFTRNMRHDPQEGILLKAIIGFMKNINLSVTAQGIETKEQVDFLLKNSCENGQGRYFSQPLTADQMTHYLANHTAPCNGAKSS
jgi:diguanylate cyclase (GGDEF)-like protein